MNKKTIMATIAVVLVIFVTVKTVISALCAPNSNGAVVSAISQVSDAISKPASSQVPVKPDPLSWDPIIHRLASFFAQVCNR